jgi:hypothetical protein
MTDTIKWLFFLQMISVERVQPYVSELGLPLEQNNFVQVMHLARGCLEAYFYFSTLSPERYSDSPGFIEAWHSYRKAERVLSDERLEQFLDRYKKPQVIAVSAYSDLQDMVGLNISQSLRQWFEENFQHASRSWEWLWALDSLLEHTQQNSIRTSPIPLSDGEEQLVKSLCTDYRMIMKEIAIRFYFANQDLKNVQPTLWESVLQAFPADGPLKSYFCLFDVERCLKHREVRALWRTLNAELGTSTTVRLNDWIKENVKLLPGATGLENFSAPPV